VYRLDFPTRHIYPERSQGITVEVLLRSGSNEFRISAKVDTGSEFCVFSRDIADALEIDLESGYLQKMSTMMGSFDTYGHELTYSVLGHEFSGVLYFAVDKALLTRNVLGRRGWLERLKVGIVEYDRHLLISDYNT